MKKILLFAFIAVFACQVFAQDTNADDETRFTVLPHAGFGVTNLMGSSTPFEGKLGYNIGVNVEYRHTDLLGFAAGLEYSAMGGKLEHYPQKINIGYVAVPLQVFLHFDEKDRFTIRGGIVPGFRSYARVKGGGVDVKAGDLVHPFDLSTTVGLDWCFPMGLTLGIEARNGWNYTLRDYTGADGRQYMLGDTKLHNAALLLNVGYKFKIKKNLFKRSR